MLSTACAKLAFCLLVYRVCSLFVLPSETGHQHWVAFAHQTGPPPEYNEMNAGTHVCAILSGRPLVAPRWTLLLGWSSGCLGCPSGMLLECFLGCPHVSTFPMRKIARTHLYNNICLMCIPHPPAMCSLIGSPVKCPCVSPGNSWRDGRPSEARLKEMCSKLIKADRNREWPHAQSESHHTHHHKSV